MHEFPHHATRRMTRRLAGRHRGRLQHMRVPPRRPEHGAGLALVPARPQAEAEPRADPRALRALADENALLARELGRVQARCTQWRDDHIVQAERLEALLMRTRGDLIARQTRVAALSDALDELEQRAANWRSQETLVRQLGDLRARNAELEAELRALRAGVREGRPGAAAARQVLCVGGRARQVPVYRELVERGGDRFDHVDGANPSSLPRLRLALADADLVILQPGYVCQGACRVVEQHCARSGVRCVQLDKACALGFARSLADATGAWNQAGGERPPPP
jgi:Uncharacterized protein conserved in bacteria (DUF2325)